MLSVARSASRWWPVAACGLVVVALFHEAVLGGQIFFERDLSLLWYPRVASMVRAVGEGAWPLWDPYPGFGVSAVADTNYQIFYPLTWLNLLISPAPFLTVFTLAHALGAMLGMTLLARRLGLAGLPAFIAGVAWMASGPWMSLVSHHHVASAAWMPWVLLALVNFVERGGWRTAVLLAVACAGQLLAGSADMCHLTAWAAPFVVLALALHGGRVVLAGKWKSAALLAGAAALAFCLAAPQWLPTIAQMRGSNRGAYDPQLNMYWSLHPLGLLELVVPGLFKGMPLSDEWRMRLSESREPYLKSLYLGVTTLPFAALGLAASDRRRRWLMGIGICLFVLAALGRHAFVYPLLLKLPVVGLFRYPVKWIIPAALLWALLVALGIQACWERKPEGGVRRAHLWLAAGLAAFVGAAAGFVALGVSGPGGWPAALMKPGLDVVQRAHALAAVSGKLVLTAGAGLLAAALLAARGLAGAGRGRGWTMALCGLVVADLVLSGSAVNSVASPALLAHRPPVLDRLDADRDDYRIYSAPPPEWRPETLLVHGPKGWTPEAAWVLGQIEVLRPMTCSRWRLYGSFDGDPTGLGQAGLPTVARLARAAPAPDALLRVLQTWNVRYVVSVEQDRFAFLERVGQWHSVAAKPLCLWRVPAPLPRVYVVDRARAQGGLDAVRELLDAGFDPRREILVEESAAARAGAASFEGVARTLARRSDRLEIEVRSSGPGYAVVVEADDPGWRALVDGRPVPVLRANLVCRAVAVPAGVHRVVFTYRPRGVVWGLCLCALGLGVILASALSWASGPGRMTGRVDGE